MAGVGDNASKQLREVVETTRSTGTFAGSEFAHLAVVRSRFSAAIERWSLPGSPYRVERDKALEWSADEELINDRLQGIIEGLAADYEAGYMSTVAQLVHADTFADFIEMATNLLDEGGYRDAAAVIAGSSLEAHLRNLATNAGVPVAKRDGYPLKPSVINAALAKAKVYEKLQQNQITAWLRLRNHSAHGEYGKYGEAEVMGMIQGVRNFMLSYPA